MRLGGKVAVITGAASGIGRATALLFAREGARVVVADIQEGEGRSTEDAIRASGGQATFVRCDVSRSVEVQGLFAETISRYGGLDILFANAGVPGFATRLADTSEARWRRIIDVNLTGVFLCLKYGIPVLASAGGGSAILTASIGGLAAFPGSAAYSAAKGGIVALARTAAIEYAEPLKRMGTPGDVARLALFLASDESAYVTGLAIPVDGGVVAGNISPGWPIQKEEEEQRT